MNGAQALIRTLVDAGVDVCFANPGTSEMHFVAALDDVPEMRAVLGLFEGVATGAADGYGRMAGRPAATLLHLGPGLGNGLANLHNARRAGTPIVNVVGDHATSHKRYDAPLSPTSRRWPATCRRGSGAAAHRRRRRRRGRRGGGGLRPAGRGRHAGPAGRRVVGRRRRARRAAADATRTPVADGGRRGGEGCSPRASPSCSCSAATAFREPALVRRQPRSPGHRGAAARRDLPGPRRARRGRPDVDRLAYLAEIALAQLAGTRHLVLAGAQAPVASSPTRTCRATPCPRAARSTCSPSPGRTRRRARARWPTRRRRRRPACSQAAAPTRLPTGPLTGGRSPRPSARCCPRARSCPTRRTPRASGLAGATAGAPRHDWLALTGGAIGHGLPVATGAAVACPDRPVLGLQADGSAMYTIQALWT